MTKSKKSPRPLKILALPPCDTWPEVRALEEAGHTVQAWYEVVPGTEFMYDLVLGANCWRMAEALKPYLDDAVDAAKKASKT